MVDAACPELVAHAIGSSETEVGDGKAETVVEAENILGLQVAVCDTRVVAHLQCVHELDECTTEKRLVVLEHLPHAKRTPCRCPHLDGS